MLKEAKKYLATAITALCLPVLWSCGGGNDADDAEKAQADALVEEINHAVERGNYFRAKILVDSLNSAYPRQIEARRSVTDLIPVIIEGYTRRQIQSSDSLIAVTQAELEEIQPLMRHVPGRDDEGYYVVDNASRPGSFLAGGIEARVNDHYNSFFVVARNTSGERIGLNSVALTAGRSTFASLEVPDTNSRVMVSGGVELVTLLADEVDALGRWAWQHRDEVDGAILQGTRGRREAQLTPEQLAQFGIAWHYSDVQKRLREALINRERLERQLQIARDQQAR